MLARVNNWRIHYDIVGESHAPVVCLVHALMADSSLWAPQLPALLAEGYRVLRLDLPGHGGSGPHPGAPTIAHLADDIASLLEELAIPRVYYVGLSIGGMIGQALAIHHPRRVASLFLSDTTCAVPASAREMWAARLKVVSAAGSLEPLADPTMDRVLTPAFRNANPQVWAALRNTIVEVLPLGLTQCAQALQEFDVAELLRGIRVPTMVACGDGDVATPPAEAKRIAGLIPGARYVEFGDARHYPNVEQARQFNAVLIEWLNSQQQPWG